MYHGSAFFLKTTVESVRRAGKWTLGEEGVSISSGKSDADRDRRAEWEHWARVEEVNLSPSVSVAQALANELQVSAEAAEILACAEVMTNESDDGLVYSYWIDFDPVAEGKLRSDLLAKFGSLE
jgi:hypothetical protein